MLASIAAACPVRERHLTDLVEQIAAIDDSVADDVDDFALLLDPSPHPNHRRRHDCAALRLEAIRPEDAVGDTGLILDRDEKHALG